jgi:DNA-binding IclR family transcriptional regulator
VTLGASGRVILANVPAPESYLNKGGKTVDVPSYLDSLRQIREQGYAISRD